MNGRPEFTSAELRSYGLSDADAQNLTERDWLEIDWLRQGHKMPLDWSNPRKGVNYTNPIIKEAVVKLLRKGVSNREVQRRVGVHRDTVRKIRASYDEIFHCRCGQESNHRGFCSHRFRRSIKRMKVMQHFTLHSPRHYIGLQIPVCRWFTYHDPHKAFRSVKKFIALNPGASLNDWEMVFQSKREAIIDAKIKALVAQTKARERADLVRPSVSDFFRKLAVPSGIQYAQDNPES